MGRKVTGGLVLGCRLTVMRHTSPVAKSSSVSCRHLYKVLVGNRYWMSCMTASSADPISLQPCFGGLGCLGMLAKAESGNTVFPPAEGFERLGSRVPSAGTGMGTWSLLVRARKQAPDLLLALGQLSGQAQTVGGLSPDPALVLTACTRHRCHRKQSTRFARLVKDEFGYTHPLPSCRVVGGRRLSYLPCFWLLSCTGRLGVVLPVPR